MENVELPEGWRTSSLAVATLVGGAVALAVGLTFLYVFVLEDRIRGRALANAQFTPPGGPATPFVVPSIIRPPVVAAADADLEDDAEVIGVLAEGKARAYVVRAFDSPFHHVVNDILGDTPISLAYCNIRDCMKVVSGGTKGRPLDFSLVGMLNGEMVVRAESGVYFHATCQPATEHAGPFPFVEYASLRTRWKSWREAHPDTEVYVGGEPAPAPPQTRIGDVP